MIRRKKWWIFGKNSDRVLTSFPHCAMFTECWNWKLTLTKKIRQINYLVISIVNQLLSRNFCEKSVGENFCNFRTTVWKLRKFGLIVKKFPSNWIMEFHGISQTNMLALGVYFGHRVWHEDKKCSIDDFLSNDIQMSFECFKIIEKYGMKVGHFEVHINQSRVT